MDTNFVLIQGNVVFNQQMSLFDDIQEDTKEGRNKAFRQVFETIIEKRNIKYTAGNTEQILLFKCKLSANLLFLQLAKRKKLETYQLSTEENDITQVSVENNYPPLNVFVDLRKQQIAVELKTNVLHVDAIITALTNIVKKIAKTCAIYFNTIDNISDFWSAVGSQDDIKEITFEMTVPNFYGASEDAKQLVDGAKNDLNAERVSLSFLNNKGKLKANINAIDSYVKYSSNAGSWKLKVKAPGESRYRQIKSSDYSIKKTIDASIIDLLKEMDNEGNIDKEYFSILLSIIEGLFENE